MKTSRILRRIASLAVVGTIALHGSLLAHGAPNAGSMLLHSTMDDAQAIFRPAVAAGLYDTMAQAVPGNANQQTDHVTFEAGQVGNAARFDGNGYDYTWPIDGLVRFRGENFDFSDPDDDGGRLDFWVKFNVNPHTSMANTWLGRTNWGDRYVNLEFTNGDFMVDVYSDINHNDRTSYGKFRVSPRDWSLYENIQVGEWHQFTILWRRNGGPHKAELHLFIDGTQQGCLTCSDFSGNLPPEGSITDFFFSPQLLNNYIFFSIDEVYAFDSWDVSGASGNFADLQIPEGVVLQYPNNNDYPQWGNPVPERNITFEFTVWNDRSATCDCDIYIDGNKVGTTTATTGAHTEWFYPQAITQGRRSWQVKCDGDRLLSPVYEFQADATVTSSEASTMGGIKGRYR